MGHSSHIESNLLKDSAPDENQEVEKDKQIMETGTFVEDSQADKLSQAQKQIVIIDG